MQSVEKIHVDLHGSGAFKVKSAGGALDVFCLMYSAKGGGWWRVNWREEELHKKAHIASEET